MTGGYMKKIINRFIFILLISFSTTCFANELSTEDHVVLEKFFFTLFEHSEGGYVLFGNKPVCINGYYAIDQFFPGSIRHKESVYLKEGTEICKKTQFFQKILHSF